MVNKNQILRMIGLILTICILSGICCGCKIDITQTDVQSFKGLHIENDKYYIQLFPVPTFNNNNNDIHMIDTDMFHKTEEGVEYITSNDLFGQNFELRYILTGSELRLETMIFKNDIERTLSYKIKVPSSDIYSELNGDIAFYQEDLLKASIKNPILISSNGEVCSDNSQSFSIEKGTGIYTVNVILNDEFLKSEDTIYPIQLVQKFIL